MKAYRQPSVDRGTSSGFRPALCNERPEIYHDERNLLDDCADRASIQDVAAQEGGTECTAHLLSLLNDVAFDSAGAARWLRDANVGFARAAVASAQAELAIVAEQLANLAGGAS